MSPPRYEVNRLVSDELIYELSIRGITEVSTVEVMRKTLRNLLRLEREGTSIDYPAYPFSFQQDSLALTNKIAEIKDLIQNFDGSCQAVYKKIFSKYAFALGRINRSIAHETEDKLIRSKLLVDIVNLKSDLDKKVRIHERSIANQTQGVLDVELISLADSDNESSSDNANIPNF